MFVAQDKSVKVSPVSGEDGDKVIFSCPRGYTLTGAQETRCLASNKWSIKVSQMQQCQEVNMNIHYLFVRQVASCRKFEPDKTCCTTPRGRITRINLLIPPVVGSSQISRLYLYIVAKI